MHQLLSPNQESSRRPPLLACTSPCWASRCSGTLFCSSSTYTIVPDSFELHSNRKDLHKGPVGWLLSFCSSFSAFYFEWSLWKACKSSSNPSTSICEFLLFRSQSRAGSAHTRAKEPCFHRAFYIRSKAFSECCWRYRPLSASSLNSVAVFRILFAKLFTLLKPSQSDLYIQSLEQHTVVYPFSRCVRLRACWWMPLLLAPLFV